MVGDAGARLGVVARAQRLARRIGPPFSMQSRAGALGWLKRLSAGVQRKPIAWHAQLECVGAQLNLRAVCSALKG